MMSDKSEGLGMVFPHIDQKWGFPRRSRICGNANLCPRRDGLACVARFGFRRIHPQQDLPFEEEAWT